MSEPHVRVEADARRTLLRALAPILVVGWIVYPAYLLVGRPATILPYAGVAAIITLVIVLGLSPYLWRAVETVEADEVSVHGRVACGLPFRFDWSDVLRAEAPVGRTGMAIWVRGRRAPFVFAQDVWHAERLFRFAKEHIPDAAWDRT